MVEGNVSEDLFVTLERKVAEDILERYGKAWVNQDPEAILELFTADATYHEWAFDKPYTGHEEIRGYWQEKVVEEQSDIEFEVINFYVDGNTLIAEWDARFYTRSEAIKNHMLEVAIMEIEGGKIKSLREYWANQPLNTKL